MKKNYIRLLAVLICAVMVLGMVPGKAHAVALQGNKMPQMQTITYHDEWQMHEITEFADLQHMVSVAVNDPDHYYNVYLDSYAADGPLVIAQDIVIPENLHLNVGEITIPSGVKMVINGSGSATYIEVNGKLELGEYCYLHVNDMVDISGSMDLCGTLYLSIYCDIAGEEKINYNGGYLTREIEFATAAELQEIADMAKNVTRPWKYIAFPTDNIHFSNPIVLPENVMVRLYYSSLQFTGAQITFGGGLELNTAGHTKIMNDVVLYADVFLSCVEDDYDTGKLITFGGNVVNYAYMMVYAPVVFDGAVKNLNGIDIWNEDGGSAVFNQPQNYVDTEDEWQGMLWVNANDINFPSAALKGLDINNFDYFAYEPDGWMPYWAMTEYNNGGSTPSVHEHSVVTDPAVAPTCLTYGSTEGAHCASCGEVLVKPEVLAPLGHFYGLNANGDSDCWNPECLTCGALRVINPNHLTASMYRMYNPNSGEHFYTGSLEERQVLEAAGWKYEGVGFTICANTGDPVYRLYEPVSGEHLYTMNTDEVAKLVAAGWINEGIALNSCPTKEVPQYRLYNPNTTIGAYHFTASAEERDVLLAAGWQDQGIGFYSCWQ